LFEMLMPRPEFDFTHTVTRTANLVGKFHS
jgi:hypothetical protein